MNCPYLFTPNASADEYEKTAVRAVRRLQAINMQGWDEMHALDRQFDGGEWSDGAHDRITVAEEERCIRIVAQRFEIEAWRLGELVMQWASVENDMFFEAIYDTQRTREVL